MVDTNGWMDAGSNVTVTAEAYLGHSFSHWSGDLDGASFSGVSVTVTMDRPRTLVAHFIDLAEALDTTNLTWQTTGTATWAPQTAITHDGADAGRSGVIGNGGWSRVKTTVTGPGLLRFTWRVSCEKNYDWFDFLVTQQHDPTSKSA